MRPCKKQILALGMLVLTALPLLLSVGLIIVQKALQFEMTERFEDEELQIVTIASEKLHWLKPGKEVLADGRLFDVESFKTSGKYTILTGFYDHEEEDLVKHILDIHAQKKDSKRPVNDLAIQFLFYPKYKETGSIIIQESWQIISRNYPVYTETAHRLDFPAPTPPPKYC